MSFFTSTSASLSFDQKDVEILAQISGPITTVQDTLFKSTELKFWKDGSPAMKALVPVTTQAGESKTLHVPASSRLHKAIGSALAAAGAADLEQGGVLGITWIGFATGKNPSNPPRDFSVRYITAADVAAQAA